MEELDEETDRVGETEGGESTGADERAETAGGGGADERRGVAEEAEERGDEGDEVSLGAVCEGHGREGGEDGA